MIKSNLRMNQANHIFHIEISARLKRPGFLHVVLTFDLSLSDVASSDAFESLSIILSHASLTC